MVLPEGGLASFLTSNLDEIDDSRLAFGSQNGINSMRETAERMAQLGRNGDDFVIHATKNERLIPVEVSEANPELMSQVDIAIANAGADPSAYVVGSETNSVNPYTGQREFNFFKKIVNKVKNVFKKVAPLIIPVALNFFSGGAFGAMSLAAQGAITGGITSLVQGGNIKDALKGALIGGVMGGVSSGIQKFVGKTDGSFGDKLGAGVEGFGDAFKSDQGFILGDTVGDLSDRDASKTFGFTGSDSTTPITDKISSGAEKFNQFLKKPPIDIETAKTQLLTGSDGSQYAALKSTNPAAFNSAASDLVTSSAANPGYSLLKTGAAGLVGATALGLFDPIEEAPLEDPYSKESESERRLRLNPGKYTASLRVPRDNATLQDIMVGPVPELYKTNLYEQYMMPQQAAAGGQMESFPRRTGYIAGPGTETSDDIPAMLSDGEFVMNAQAVRGAGGGSREKGVRKMYDMMRAFEGGAVA